MSLLQSDSMGSQSYGGVIWTKHALSRLNDRGLTKSLAWETYRSPDEKREGKEKGTTEFIRRVDSSIVTVIGKQNEKKEWVIISCWIDPPLAGSIDIQKREEWKIYKKAGFFGKFFYTFKRQLGL